MRLCMAWPAIGRTGWLFILCALPVLLMVALGVPFHQVPDEGAHAVRALEVARGQLIGRRVAIVTSGGDVVMSGASFPNNGLASVAYSFVDAHSLADKHVTRAMVNHNLAQRWGDPIFAYTNNVTGYPPIFYLGSALGLKLGKALGVQPFLSLYLARLFNIGVYLLLGLAAVTVARGLRPVLLATLLFPTALWLGGSISQDGPMIATSALVAALLSRATGPGGWRYWTGGALLACVIAARPVYLPLGAVMVLIGWTDGKLWAWRRLAGLAVAGLPPILWFFASRAVASGPMIGSVFTAGPLWPGTQGQTFAAVDVGNNLKVLLADPWRFVTIPWNTFSGEWHFMFKRMINGLGAGDVELPALVTTLWIGALCAAVLAAILRRSHDPRPMPFAGPVMIGGVAFTVLFIYIGLYLTWTQTGQPIVEGVQGRYFIPVLLIATLALPRFSLSRLPQRSGAFGAWLLLLPGLALGLAGLVLMPAIILSSYYLR